MAEGVFDGFETVEVQKQNAQPVTDALAVGALQSQQGMNQAVFKQQAVGQTGQRVGKAR